ncbi:MAG TPA: DPP IV N-terminal domain-containing protein [Pyrinomonadaceae bacterium]|nr:DPP IV N-terminal domain-containing protein [Pyrinomonadaceae bacterium]
MTTSRVTRLARAVLPCALLLVACHFVARAQDKQLTVEDIYDPARKASFGNEPVSDLKWLNDGEHYLWAKKDGGAKATTLLRVNARTGRSEPFFDAARMEAALARLPGVTREDAAKLARKGSYTMSPSQTGLLLNHANDLFYYDTASGSAVRLTSGPGEESEEDFSPDGRMVSFVRANNLHVVELATQRERALTSDGSATVLNGVLDWVYEEELYGRGNKRGYWWSPDSARIAYLRLDEARVKTFPVVDHIPREQVLEDTPYPLAGEPNPLVTLGVVGAAGGETTWVDLSGYEPTDLLVVRVAWSPDSRRVVYQAQNREQTYLDLNAADAGTGKTTRLFQEKTPAWVEVVDNPLWLRDGSFLWRSERTGWAHIYHYSGDGKLIRQVTDGKWEARSLEGVDEKAGWAYFRGTEHSHIADHIYRVRLDGTGLTRLSKAEGNHSATFNPQFTLFIDKWSDINTPAQTRVHAADGSAVRVVDENRADALRQYRLGAAEFLQVRSRDGFPMEAMMIKPPGFDPSKKYPVMSFTYGGPHAPQVKNNWGGQSYLWHQMLAQKGYIIWVLDNRTASGEGAESAWMGYKKMGVLELQDLEDGVSYLKGLPYVDGSRIGLWGWSYGGFMTSYALTHSKSFRLGIAGGSVTDWANYDSIYTERIMRTPQNNPEGYAETSVLRAAKNLSGKLLLIHGAIDDNVHMSNTIQLAYELQKAGKPFRLMLYPKSRHGVSDPLLLKHMRQMMADFILENL